MRPRWLIWVLNAADPPTRARGRQKKNWSPPCVVPFHSSRFLLTSRWADGINQKRLIKCHIFISLVRGRRRRVSAFWFLSRRPLMRDSDFEGNNKQFFLGPLVASLKISQMQRGKQFFMCHCQHETINGKQNIKCCWRKVCNCVVSSSKILFSYKLVFKTLYTIIILKEFQPKFTCSVDNFYIIFYS